MSPFLFVLAMEHLSCQFTLLKASSEFSFHPKCSWIGLTHLCFADDLMVFCRADVPAVRSVMTVLESLGCTSGLVMNPHKSMLYLGGVSEALKAEIIQATAMVEGTLPTRYLGITLHQHSLNIAEYRPLMHKFQMKVNN